MSQMERKPSASMFENILENHPDMILIKREKSKLAWANKAFRDLYGMTNEQLANIVDSPINEPDYTLQYVQDDKWVWENKRPLQIDCEPVTRHDGVVRKLSTLKYPVFDESGEIVYSVGVSQDITDRIETAQKLESNAKMAALGEMAGGIAHEINNPLTVITAKSRQLRKMFEKNMATDTGTVIQDLQKIEHYAERIARIVSGLRSFSRDGTNDVFQLVPVVHIIDDTLELCSARIASHGIDLKLDIKKDLSLECRAVQISQVILNLLSNAVNAVEEAKEKTIWVSCTDEGNRICLIVRDSGPGVPESIATKIMQPFFTTKEIGKGTGLGLSISQSIVKDHGGTLKLDHTISPSCFRITLPKRQPTTTPTNKGGAA